MKIPNDELITIQDLKNYEPPRPDKSGFFYPNGERADGKGYPARFAVERRCALHLTRRGLGCMSWIREGNLLLIKR